MSFQDKANLPTPYFPGSPVLRARPYLRAVDRNVRDPFPRFELTSFFASPKALQQFAQDILNYFSDDLPSLDAFICLDALGFLVGGALSGMSGKSLIPARKGGKLAMPEEGILRTGRIQDYMEEDAEKRGKKALEKNLEIRKDLIKPGMKVIIIDEWIDTGGQMTSLIEMLEREGVVVVGIATLHVDGEKEKGGKLWRERKMFAANATPLE